jgi:hypothetical protein
MNTSPSATIELVDQPTSFMERRSSSSPYIYDKEKMISTRDMSLQPRSPAPYPPSIVSRPTTRKKSIATSIVESDTDFSHRFSTYSAKSISEDLLHEATVPPAENPPATAPEASQSGMSLIHQIAFIAVACLAQFLSLGGMNQTVAPVMVLAKYFNINDYGTLSWFSAAYSMSVGTFILPAGRFANTPSMHSVI